MTVGETGDLGKGAEEVLEDDEEDEQEGDGEREQEHADGLGEDEGLVADAGGAVEVHVGLAEDGQNELLAY